MPPTKIQTQVYRRRPPLAPRSEYGSQEHLDSPDNCPSGRARSSHSGQENRLLLEGRRGSTGIRQYSQGEDSGGGYLQGDGNAKQRRRRRRQSRDQNKYNSCDNLLDNRDDCQGHRSHSRWEERMPLNWRRRGSVPVYTRTDSPDIRNEPGSDRNEWHNSRRNDRTEHTFQPTDSWRRRSSDSYGNNWASPRRSNEGTGNRSRRGSIQGDLDNTRNTAKPLSHQDIEEKWTRIVRSRHGYGREKQLCNLSSSGLNDQYDAMKYMYCSHSPASDSGKYSQSPGSESTKYSQSPGSDGNRMMYYSHKDLRLIRRDSGAFLSDNPTVQQNCTNIQLRNRVNPDVPHNHSNQDMHHNYGNPDMPRKRGNQDVSCSYGNKGLPSNYGSQDIAHNHGNKDVPSNYGNKDVPRNHSNQVAMVAIGHHVPVSDHYASTSDLYGSTSDLLHSSDTEFSKNPVGRRRRRGRCSLSKRAP